MGNFDPVISAAYMACDRVCDEYRAVPAAGTANRYRHVRLALLFILGKQEIDERVDVIEELVCRFVGIHVLNDRRIGARVRLQMRDEVRIRQEPDVEDQIRIYGNAILEPETYE